MQVVNLIGRNKSANKSFDHFVTNVCERVKRCALNKVTNVTDWFTTMIIVANHDDTDVRKKLLLHQDLKLDKAKAICKEEKKAAKMSRMLGASRTSSSDNYGSSQVQLSESFRKQRSLSIKGPKHKFLLQVRQITPRHVSGD